MTAKDARREMRCMRCGATPIKAKREDGAGIRGVWWCVGCNNLAFAGDSFIKVDARELDSLPLVRRIA